MVHANSWFSCFFFQAEDGIRDGHVTGVQTCALPIFASYQRRKGAGCVWKNRRSTFLAAKKAMATAPPISCGTRMAKIGRASCRERVEIEVVGGSLKQKSDM